MNELERVNVELVLVSAGREELLLVRVLAPTFLRSRLLHFPDEQTAVASLWRALVVRCPKWQSLAAT